MVILLCSLNSKLNLIFGLNFSARKLLLNKEDFVLPRIWSSAHFGVDGQSFHNNRIDSLFKADVRIRRYAILSFWTWRWKLKKISIDKLLRFCLMKSKQIKIINEKRATF